MGTTPRSALCPKPHKPRLGHVPLSWAQLPWPLLEASTSPSALAWPQHRCLRYRTRRLAKSFIMAACPLLGPVRLTQPSPCFLARLSAVSPAWLGRDGSARAAKSRRQTDKPQAEGAGSKLKEPAICTFSCQSASSSKQQRSPRPRVAPSLLASIYYKHH